LPPAGFTLQVAQDLARTLRVAQDAA